MAVSSLPVSSSLRRVATRLYVPAAVGLLLVLANKVTSGVDFNPMTAAQNPRLTMSAGDGAAQKGFMVIRPLFEAGSPYTVLTTRIPINEPGALSILFLGNSQTIATMDEQPGDRFAPVWLSDLLNDGSQGAPGRFVLRIGSEPNLRMAEMLVKSVLACSEAERKMDVVVSGIVLDGLRWVDPREDIADVAKDPKVRAELASVLEETADLPAARRVILGLLMGDVQDAGRPGGGSKQADPMHQEGPAARAEAWLQDRLDGSIPLFRERRAIYGQIFVGFLAVRNRALGVRTSSRRPIPPGMYATNMELIEATLRYLKRRGVHSSVYFAPIRPIEPNPYEPQDIERFRQDLLSVCRRCGSVAFDYSNLVPEEMWTNYPDANLDVGGERDFAHFTGRAHQRLGTQLEHDLRPLLEKWLTEKQEAHR